MTRKLTCIKDYYTEEEAARFLDVTLERLHYLLDEHIFNDGSPRPDRLTFSDADLVLLAFWNKTAEQPKLLRMPMR